MSSLIREIGGYPPLELPCRRPHPHDGATGYQSARAALAALLASMPDVRRVWMPAYVCDSMLSSLEFSAKECVFYHLQDDFQIGPEVELQDGDLLLFVDYFGVCGKAVAEVLGRFPRDRVVIDCSQAFFQQAQPCLATLYSPRKFFGVPDGGLLVTAQKMRQPALRDDRSSTRMRHLVTRLSSSAAEGYASFKDAEASLVDPDPRRISILSERLLQSIDYEGVQNRRGENFRFLHEQLGSENQLKLDEYCDAPLCYPFLPRANIDKRCLADLGIFVPTYWSEVADRPNLSQFEQRLLLGMLALPIGQVLDVPADLEFIVESVREML
ncbi:MAG: hypothetical protein ABS98_04690 [Lysobacteraceae bacterium SCN 69-48]|nr:MAG: hypothetical protein ABS98_04690 [Xanthomonadaceae bacterium SCN 69-48]